MRILDRTVALYVGVLVASVFAPGVVHAQVPQHLAQQLVYQPAPDQPSTPGDPQQQASPQQGYPQEAAPPLPATRRGLLFLPYVGFGSVAGTGSDRYSTGLHLGAMLGGHIGSRFSLNGELGTDIMNPKTGRYIGLDITEDFFDLTLSPLIHFGVPHVELVVGPKIGAFAWVASTTYPNVSADFSGFGAVYGFTAGSFFPIGRMAIGGTLSFTGRKFLKDSCSISGGGQCYDYYSTVDTKSISFSVALML